MQTLKLFIPGIPKPKQSVRTRIVQPENRKPFVTHYQSKAVKDEERSIRMIVQEQLPEGFRCHDGPIEVFYLLFAFPVVSSLKAWQRRIILDGQVVPKITKPDLTDNLAKGCFDAMEGIVYTNDSKIFKVYRSGKVYSSKPGTTIHMHLFENLDEWHQNHMARMKDLHTAIIQPQ